MTIFFNSPRGTIAIPYDKICEIRQHRDKIYISHEAQAGGWLDEENFVTKVTIEEIFFDSADLANSQMRGFYKACENNKGAFFFG